MKLIIATRNDHKVKEIRQLLQGMPIEFLSLKDCPAVPEIIEKGEIFEENAFKKASETAFYTDGVVLADDSGLEVDCLNGQPGVYSSRFAHDNATDEENIQKLLFLLKNVPYQDRTAQFVCSIVIIFRDGSTSTAKGVCRGIIAEQPRGSEGFGYDPVFIPEGYTKTFAELGDTVKNSVSHRAIALQNVLNIVNLFLGNDYG